MTAPGQTFGEQHPCTFGPCGQPDTRPYPEGWRCPGHTPAARAGKPEPDTGRYCLAICYCGQCPHYRRVLAPITPNVVDFRAVADGKRRAKSDSEYRDAQAKVQRSRQEWSA